LSEHPDFSPTGDPTVGRRRDWGTVPLEERFGVGVVGLHEGHTMLVALRASGLCRAVAGCDLSAEKRSAAEQVCPGLWTTESFEAMLSREDVGIVAIYTPDHLHAQQIEQAFAAGKHVICTKPLVNDVSVAERLMRAAEESGMRLQVAQSTRFYEPFLRMKELYDEGAFGTAEVVDAQYSHRMDWFYRKSPWALTETHWAYLGLSHPADLVRQYLGNIVEVHAVGSLSALGRSHGLSSPDVIAATLVADDGRIGRVFGNYGIHELPRGRSLIECHLQGTEGSALARYPELRLTYCDRSGTEINEDWSHTMAGYYYRHELKGMHYGEFCNIADSFAAAIRSGSSNSPDLEEGLGTVAVMDAIVRSLESGQTWRIGR
jgi:predicted dehydrogenase